MSNLQTLASKLRTANRPQGKLVIALDATASRRDTWNTTKEIMRGIFRRLTDLGDLEISVGYFRGHDECQFTDFTGSADDLIDSMESIDCRTGSTQISKVLDHFVEVVGTERPSALVFIGDAQEEPIEVLRVKATTLAAFGVPMFWFLERTSDTRNASGDYLELAKASGGVFADFNDGTADKLEELLVAAARFAIGGKKALEGKGEAATLLLTQLR